MSPGLTVKVLFHIMDRVSHVTNLMRHSIIKCGRLRKSELLSIIKDIDKQRFLPSLNEDTYEVAAITKKKLYLSIREVLNHNLDLLGSNASVEVGKDCALCFGNSSLWNSSYTPIEWHRDNLSNFNYPALSRPTSCLNEYRRRSIEIKWPWELSRVQHLPLLGLLSQISNNVDEIHIAWHEFQFQTLDWIWNNPYGLGVNWTCPMDVGIRAVNFLTTYVLFGHEYDPLNKWSSLFFRSINRHIDVLRRALKVSHGNNHATAEAASLYMACALLPHPLQDPVLMERAKRALDYQIRRQIRRDGTQFEGSVYYHLFTFEMWFYPAVIGSAVGDDFGDSYRTIIRKMYNVLKEMTSSQFELSQIGDRDDGFLLKPLGAQSDQVRLSHLFRLVEKYLVGINQGAVNRVLCDILLPEQESVTAILRPAEHVTEFQDSGWITLRQGIWQVVLSTGGLTREATGHEHNDSLSFSLFGDGLAFIVDPGTYRYTSDIQRRQLFRSALSHNQPHFRDLENPFASERCFAHFIRPTVAHTVAHKEGEIVELKSNATSNGSQVCRNIALNQQSNEITIEDVFDGKGIGRIALCLHPEVKCLSLGPSTYLLKRGGLCLKLETNGFSFSMQVGPYSPKYGHLIETTWLIFEKPIENGKCLWSLGEVRS